LTTSQEKSCVLSWFRCPISTRPVNVHPEHPEQIAVHEKPASMVVQKPTLHSIDVLQATKCILRLSSLRKPMLLVLHCVILAYLSVFSTVASIQFAKTPLCPPCCGVVMNSTLHPSSGTQSTPSRYRGEHRARAPLSTHSLRWFWTFFCFFHVW